MDIRNLFGKKHPKLIKIQREYEILKQEEDQLIAECRECEKCDDLKTHIQVCLKNEIHRQ